MNKTLLLLITFIASIASNGQEAIQGLEALTQIGQGIDQFHVVTKTADAMTKGSQYLNENFTEGWILLKSNRDTIKDVKLRYNLYRKVLEWEKSSSDFMILFTDPIRSFGLMNGPFMDTFINPELLGKKDSENFLKTIYKGSSISIYLDYFIDKNVHEPQPYGPKQKIIELDQQSITYFNTAEGLVRVKNKKDFNELLDALNKKPIKVKNAQLSDPVYLRKLGKQLDH